MTLLIHRSNRTRPDMSGGSTRATPRTALTAACRLWWTDDDSGYASDDSYSVMPFVPARHHPLGTRGGTEARLASWVNGRRVAFGGGPSPQLACELAAWVEYEVRRLLSLAGLGSTGLGRGLARPDTAGAPSRS